MKTRCVKLVSNILISMKTSGKKFISNMLVSMDEDTLCHACFKHSRVCGSVQVVREAETERERVREREKEIEREMEIQSIREIRRVQTNQLTARQTEESKRGFLFTIGLWC